MEKDSPRSSVVSANLEFKVYPRRWLVLISVTLLTLSNNILWISFASVNVVSARYFQTSSENVDFFTTISFIIGIPFSLLSTYIVDKLGLKVAVLFGSAMTFIGGLVRCFSTLPPYSDTLDIGTQYWLAVAGQAITGIGNPIAVSLPTKVV